MVGKRGILGAYLAVGGLGHGLHGLEISDLHGGGAGQDVGGLAHEFGALNLGAGADDLGFTRPLALGGHGQALLEFVAEDDVLDQHALDGHTPAGRGFLDDFADGLSDLLATLDDVLQHAGADDVSERSLGALDQGGADVGDAEGGLVRARDVIVDDRGQSQVDVVLGHAHLFGHLDDLDLDVDLDEALGQGVDADETWIHGARESAEFGDQADVSLGDGLVRVGTADACECAR